MKWLIKQVRILASESRWDDQVVDVMIADGKIEKIGVGLSTPVDTVFDAKGACLSPGWMDIGCFNGDPGYEHREDLNSLAAAALAGGYTAIAPLPNTFPPVESQADVNYLRKHPAAEKVEIFPLAVVTEGAAGKAITELIDLHRAGAIAFTDGLHSLQHGGVMMRALEYVKQFGGLVMNRPDDALLSAEGQLHEGVESTLMGLPGIPALAEELMLYRDLRLTEYTGSRLFVSGVSTRGAVQLIRQARSEGLEVFSAVPVLNLAFEAAELTTFDSNLKVQPPLRTAEDREALIAGLLDGTVDCILSGHLPLEEDLKMKEFPYAAFGAIGLETAFALANTVLGEKLELRLLIEKFSAGPRKILGIPVPEIDAGVPANFTIFDPEKAWQLTRSQIRSRSKNSPLFGKPLKGKVLATFFGKETHVNAD